MAHLLAPTAARALADRPGCIHRRAETQEHRRERPLHTDPHALVLPASLWSAAGPIPRRAARVRADAVATAEPRSLGRGHRGRHSSCLRDRPREPLEDANGRLSTAPAVRTRMPRRAVAEAWSR